MPPKLNLNINFNIANKINSIGSVDDTSGSKRSINAATPNEENKNNNGNNNALNLPNKLNINLNNENKENNDILEKDDDDFLDEDDEDLDLIPYNDPLINKEKDKSCLKKIRIPKLMVSLQKNVLNEEKLTERAKIKSEQEENLNLLPESTLISTSQHIINKMNNLGMNKINLSGLNQINTNQNGNNVPNNKSNNPENENQEEIDIKALNEDYSLKDSERKKSYPIITLNI